MGEAGQTVGERIYLIREALGTRRDPMPLDKFAEHIEKLTGVSYDKSVLSRMETGDRKVGLDDVELLARIDPEKRGRDWLGWGGPPLPKTKKPPAGGSRSETGIDSDTTENFVPDPRSAQKRRRGNG